MKLPESDTKLKQMGQTTFSFGTERAVAQRNVVCPLLVLALGCARIGMAATSFTGTLANSTDVFETTVMPSSPVTLTLQTWGFGGGTNALGTPIPAGGFDPLVAVFAGIGSSAVFVAGTSDGLSNYSPTFVGCPPAGLVTIGTTAECGDVLMTLALSAGTYTILLSDGEYIPNAAVGFGTTLGDGFFDLTGGMFQTCLPDGSACNTDTANWALDVSVSGSSPVPEPAGCGMACLGLLGWAAVARLRSGVGNRWFKRPQGATKAPRGDNEGVQI